MIKGTVFGKEFVIANGDITCNDHQPFADFMKGWEFDVYHPYRKKVIKGTLTGEELVAYLVLLEMQVWIPQMELVLTKHPEIEAQNEEGVLE